MVLELCPNQIIFELTKTLNIKYLLRGFKPLPEREKGVLESLKGYISIRTIAPKKQMINDK